MKKVCVYCGKKPTTKDHIPPKRIFSKPRPDSLITVPSCEDCNASFQLDDEYFDLMLSMTENVENNEDVLKRRKSIIRNLSRPESKGLLKMVQDSVRHVVDEYPNGEERTRVAISINYDRINSLIARVIKGLFYVEKGVRLPDNLNVLVREFESIDVFNKQAVDSTIRILKMIQNSEWRTIREGVFEYQMRFAEDSNVGGIIINIFGRFSFLGLVVPYKEFKRYSKN